MSICSRFACAWIFGLSVSAIAAEPAAKPGIDAPELAHLGAFAVGVRS